MRLASPLFASFRKLNIVKQVLTLYVILIFIPAGVGLFLYYDKSSSLIEEEYNSATLNTLNQTANNIAYYFRSVTNASNVFISNPRMYQYLDEETAGAPIDLYLQIQEMREVIGSIENNPDVFKVRIFVDPDLQYAREKIRFFSLEAIQGEAWYPEVLRGDGKIHWISTYEQTYLDEVGAYPIISAARIIRHPSDFDKVIGIVLVDMKEQLLADSLSHAKIGEASSLYVMSREGRVIAQTDAAMIGTQRLVGASLDRVNASAGGGYFKLPSDNGGHYILHQPILNTDWRIVAEIPVSQISSKNKTFTKMSGVIVAVITFVVFVLSLALLFAFIMKGINRRMGKILRIMERGGAAAEYSERLEEDSGVLRKLERNIVRTIHNVNRLTEETYLAKLQERESTLRALQAQINPHFLYNTLERINWMAIRRDAADISAVIGSLSTYFRLTLNNGKDIVTVEDEIKLSRTYLDIQKSRFGDQFDANFHIDEAALPLKMPKLVLQPVIENALLHGIRKRSDRQGQIDISAGLEGDSLVLAVSDDGIGMPPAKAKAIMEHRPEAEERGSYGLYNVNERIRMFAGDAYGLTIESEEGAGTRVEIRLRATE